jgi:hypothetical protein
VKLLVSADWTNWGSRSQWIDGIFRGAPDAGRYIDGISVHPYGPDPDITVAQDWQSFQRIDGLRQEFLDHGVDKPLWITEIGWALQEVTEAEQVRNYEHLFKQVHARRAWIQGLFAYGLRDTGDGKRDSSFGLLYQRDGVWTERPAASALRAGFGTL